MNCCICLEEVNEETSKTYTKCCGNQFHYECLHKWNLKDNSCPLCKEKLVDEEESNSQTQGQLIHIRLRFTSRVELEKEHLKKLIRYLAITCLVSTVFNIWNMIEDE